jgi:hypothetical protein
MFQTDRKSITGVEASLDGEMNGKQKSSEFGKEQLKYDSKVTT